VRSFALLVLSYIPMINSIFSFTASFLHKLSSFTGFTYNQINIIVYYFIVPFSWCILLDVIFDFHLLKLGFLVLSLGFRIGCTDFKTYSDKAFDKSVQFLNYFNRLGSNYYKSSVLICILLPIIIYTVLFLRIINETPPF